MEELGILIACVVVGLLIVLPIWLVSSIVSFRRRVESDHPENSQHWQDLTARLHVQKTQFKDLKTAGDRSQSAAQEKPEPQPEAPRLSAPTEEVLTSPRPIEATAPSVPPAPVSVPPIEAAPSRQGPAVTPAVPPPQPATPAPRVQVPRPEATTSVRPEKPRPSRWSALDLEEMLGTNWLNKIGLASLFSVWRSFSPINCKIWDLPERSCWASD